MELCAFTSSPIGIDFSSKKYDIELSVENTISSFSFTDKSLRENLTEVTIPASSKISAVPSYAFDGCGSLVSASMSSIRIGDIGVGAFNDCSSLLCIQYDTSYEQHKMHLNESTFAGCKSLVQSDWTPLTAVGYGAFAGCSSLVSVQLGGKGSSIFDSIGMNAFKDCTSLKEVDMLDKEDLPSLGTGAFENCTSLQTVKVNDNEYKSYIVAANWNSISSKLSSYTQPEVTFLCGESILKKQVLNYRMSADLPSPLPSRTAYDLTGWSGSYTDVVADTSCYAQFSATTYSITYDLDGGSSTENPASYTIETPTITLLSDTTKENYDFIGWYDADKGQYINSIPQGSYGNKEISAVWKRQRVKLVYDTGYEGPKPVTGGNWATSIGCYALWQQGSDSWWAGESSTPSQPGRQIIITIDYDNDLYVGMYSVGEETIVYGTAPFGSTHLTIGNVATCDYVG